MGKGPQRRPQQRFDRRLEEVAKTVGGGYCQLQMPLRLHLASGEQWLGVGWAPWRGGGGGAPPLAMHPCFAAPVRVTVGLLKAAELRGLFRGERSW